MKKVLERIKGLNILVFGDVMLDRYVNGEVSRISPEAQYQFYALKMKSRWLVGRLMLP